MQWRLSVGHIEFLSKVVSHHEVHEHRTVGACAGGVQLSSEGVELDRAVHSLIQYF